MLRKVINDVWTLHCQLKQDAGPSDYQPKIAIYMERRFAYECLDSLSGFIPSTESEFANNRTIFGFPVYLVVNQGAGFPQHRQYTVVNLDSKPISNSVPIFEG